MKKIFIANASDAGYLTYVTIINFFGYSVSFLRSFGSLGDGCMNCIHFNRWFRLLQFRHQPLLSFPFPFRFFSIRLTDDFKEKKEDMIFYWLRLRSAKCKCRGGFFCLFIQRRRRRRIYWIIQVDVNKWWRLHAGKLRIHGIIELKMYHHVISMWEFLTSLWHISRVSPLICTESALFYCIIFFLSVVSFLLID